MITKEILIEILNSQYRWDLIDLFVDTQEKFDQINYIYNTYFSKYTSLNLLEYIYIHVFSVLISQILNFNLLLEKEKRSNKTKLINIFIAHVYTNDFFHIFIPKQYENDFNDKIADYILNHFNNNTVNEKVVEFLEKIIV